MVAFISKHRVLSFGFAASRRNALSGGSMMAFALAAVILAPARPQQPSQPGTPFRPVAPQAPAPAPWTWATTEEELGQQLVGKTLYLRNGYLDDTLAFDEQGRLNGHSPQGSYTLCLVQIEKIRLTRRKVELEGARYGVHFLGVTPYGDSTSEMDKVRITPKKKILKIVIDRELVVAPKKEKKPADANKIASTHEPTIADADVVPLSGASNPTSRPQSVTTTTSPAHAAQLLQSALDRIFAQGLDDRMVAAMPDFWRLYYQTSAAHADFLPQDPGILRQNAVDQKARLLSSFEPPSNEYAQANGVAGIALYHAVIGANGKPQQIAIGRPIGLGLDENAVEAIRKAAFQPATKDGKPVPVLLDMLIQFRIYSKRTTAVRGSGGADKPDSPVLPGPYSVGHP